MFLSAFWGWVRKHPALHNVAAPAKLLGPPLAHILLPGSGSIFACCSSAPLEIVQEPSGEHHPN